MSDYFEIGKIVNTQGLRGEVRVIPFTDEPDRFELLSDVDLRIKSLVTAYAIEGVRYHKGFVLLKFKGVDSMTDAEKLKNYIITIPAENALPLSEDQYYLRDLIGLEVFDENENHVGTLTEVLFNLANDVYVVKSEGKKDVLIPAVKKFVLSVDIKNKKMVAHIEEGLIQ